jgi:hypothetical protein
MRVYRYLVFFLAFLASFHASAALTAKGFVYNDSGQMLRVVPGAYPGTFTLSPYLTNGIELSSTLPIQVATSLEPIAVKVAQTATADAVMVAGGRVLAKLASPQAQIALALGEAAYDWYTQNRISTDGKGGLKRDPGVPPNDTPQLSQCVNGYEDVACGPNGVQACQAGFAYAVKQGIINSSRYHLDPYTWDDGHASCLLRDNETNNYGGPWAPATHEMIKITKTCDKVTDQSTGEQYDAGIFGDGKCASGAYSGLPFTSIPNIVVSNPPKPEQTQGVARDALNKGESIEGSNPVVSGPSSSPGPTTNKTVNPAPTVQNPNPVPIVISEGTTNKYTYNNTNTSNTITHTVVTTTTNNTTNEVTTTETPVENVTLPDNPDFDGVPSLYTRVYPDGMVGVWDSNVAALKQTPIFTFLSSLNPNIGDGGCPVWSFSPGSVLHIPVSGDLSVPCYVWTALRLVMIISALLMARRLIFGG